MGDPVSLAMGVQRRLHRLFPPGQAALWLPLDDSLIAGPEAGLRRPRAFLQPELVQHIDAVIGFRGMLAACSDQLLGVPLILNMSASTTLVEHTHKVMVGQVSDAFHLDMDAIACHVNYTSPHEKAGMEQLARLASEAGGGQMPLVAMAYPRGRMPDGSDNNYLDMRANDPDSYTALVRRCVRTSVDLGANAVKTIYTGSVDSFRTVIDAAMGVPVVIAGEALADADAVIAKARGAIQAGAAGVAYGRQIFERDDPATFVRQLRKEMDEEWLARSVGKLPSAL